MELFKAHQQWKDRPDDERFPTVQALYDATKAYASDAREKTMPFGDLRTEAIEGDVQLIGKANVPAKFTHWSFSQICGRISAPASYLRELPATLAVQNLNHGLAKRSREENLGDAQLLFHTNGGLLLRSLTSDRYARIWNYEVAERLLELGANGWLPATPDMAAIPGKETALYASDHDMFAFLKNPGLAIREAGSNDPLQRGVIVENSEVGAAALKLTRFLYRRLCANHIIWGASEVVELSLRHVGHIRDRMQEWDAALRRYANESPADQEAKIAKARTVRIAGTKEEVLDRLFGMRSLGLTRKALDASYNAVNLAEDGDPRTAWGIVQGITRHSQTIPYADERTRLDRAAGKILEVTF